MFEYLYDILLFIGYHFRNKTALGVSNDDDGCYNHYDHHYRYYLRRVFLELVFVVFLQKCLIYTSNWFCNNYCFFSLFFSFSVFLSTSPCLHAFFYISFNIHHIHNISRKLSKLIIVSKNSSTDYHVLSCFSALLSLAWLSFSFLLFYISFQLPFVIQKISWSVLFQCSDFETFAS